MTEWLPTALGQGDEGSLPSTLDARGPLPSLRSPSSTTSGDFTSRGSSFPAIFQHAADTRALWWLVTQKHATAERRYSVHVSGASLRISWPGWRATGDQLTEVDHPEISERQLARTRAARGSKLQLSETRGRTRVLVVGVLSVAHTRRNYRQASLCPIFAWVVQCVSPTTAGAVWWCTSGAVPSHKSSCNSLWAVTNEQWAVEAKWICVKILDLSHCVKSGTLPWVT